MKTDTKAEALSRAASGISMSNYPAIVAGFIEKGIPADQIEPRRNVFTFTAWKALGRVVNKGEHGVKITVWIETEKNGEKTRRPWHTTVFHETQTKPLD